MAIDRGPWNGLIDDDGSNLVGTVWNKATIKSVLLDPMDAAVLGGPTKSLLASNATGTVNDWNPGITGKGHTVIIWDAGSDLTITGFAGGTPGQTVTIKNRGTANIKTTYLGSGSAAGNRLLNLATSAPTPIAFDGWATYLLASTGNWYLVGHEQGAWLTPPFSAADYSGSSGGWTVEAADVITCRTRLGGRTLHWNLRVNASTVTAATSWLTRKIPGDLTVVGSTDLVYKLNDPGGAVMASCQATGTTLNLFKNLAGATGFTGSTNATELAGSWIVDVQ